MINIYIGYDKSETVAYHVLCHSIIERSSLPVSITPINRENLKGFYNRPRGELDSTDFSNSRFLVPILQGYQGWAIFMDCDMICLGDIADLWMQRDASKAVMVKKHNHVPTEETKFLGAAQTKYDRKNWSSLMLMNTNKCDGLTKRIVNTAPGLWLHQFGWLEDDEIGEIQGNWNHLVDVDEGYNPKEPIDLIHYTKGGPWHKVDSSLDHVWLSEYEHMIQGENPVDWLADDTAPSVVANA